MDHVTPRLARRLLILKASALGGIATTLAGKAPAAASLPPAPVRPVDAVLPAQRATDSDPTDTAGNGRGRRNTTDSDPRDSAGQGRGAARRVTDSDPRDSAGAGRGSGRAASDSDPNDRAGMGRGGRGATDTDPRDAAGSGRGR